MFTVTKRMEISGAHFLRLNYESKCTSLHGHNWIVTVTVQNDRLDENGMVVDFTKIKDIVNLFDHRCANDIMEGLNPTAENMAKCFATAFPTVSVWRCRKQKEIQRYMKNKFPVAEIFDSIEGEGKRTGYMAVFVRFAGCNIRCTYCDTAYALKESDAEEFLTKEELLGRIRSYPWKRITFTGGEPLLQPLQEICDILGEEGYEINIETNGAVPLLARRSQNLFYTMDYKCTDSGMKSFMRLPNLKELTEEDVLKFVVSSKTDLEDMKEIIIKYFPRGGPKFYVSPVWGKIEPRELVEYVRKEKLAEVCVQVQLHKIIWEPDRRGV